jgi:sugar/nucleoside kinase (ribokinase family)
MRGMKKYDVLVIGELNIDLIMNKIDAFPALGKEILAGEMTVTLGSSSAIFANNLSMLGSKVTYMGKVGNDQFAEQIFSALNKAGIDTGNIIKTRDFLTGLTVALNYGNDRAMVTYPGAMNNLSIRDITDDTLNSSSHMHLSSVFLQPGIKPDVIRLYKRAKDLGLSTSFDPQWDPHEKWDVDLMGLLPYVDVFLPNLNELLQFTSSPSIEKAIETIKPYCQFVVVKNGEKGAMMWDKQTLITQKAFLNESIIDAIGAGDSFNAGFIYQYSNKKPLAKCLEFAALTGAINTTGSGGTSAFETLDKVKNTARDRFNYTF